jgi:signal transduction histidine kinase/CheY-like chemotaxis protein
MREGPKANRSFLCRGLRRRPIRSIFGATSAANILLESRANGLFLMEYLREISDLLIAAAYFWIPFTLLYFVRRRKDLPFNWMFICFGIFIVACGLTHVMEIWTLWKPYYWISDAVKAITALTSVPTGILLIRLVPQALQIPGPAIFRKEHAARVEAEAANKAKDRFLAMLSHELRTPLTPVLASVELLDQELGSETNFAVAVIRRNVELEARLIDDMLDLTAITQGKLNLSLEIVDAHSVLHGALEILRPEIEQKGVKISFNLNAAEHFVEADSARLMQVFWNLIKNATKFTPDGGEIKFSSRNEAGKLVVDVIDNGVGIGREFLSRIFESFEQGERQVQGGQGGLGLGLAISKAIVDAHQGELTANSQGRGCGTTMTLRMRVVAPPAFLLAEQHLTPEQSSSAIPPSHPLRILLVDDHKDTVFTLKRLLTRLGYEVATAESFHDALELAATKSFNLLVSDIGLPDGNGLDLLKQIREHQRIDGIALSGFGMEDDLRKSREAGFADYLIKPVNLDRLQAAIRQVASQ